jgi:microcystin-dependent protein
MTSTERNAIVNPAIGLVVYDTNENIIYVYTGTWTRMGGDKIPVGTINAYAGTVAPEGWMFCDGSTFNGSTYPELQTVLGGTTLPDLRGVFLRGLDNGRGVDTGRTIRSFQQDATARPNNSFTTNTTGAHSHTTALPRGDTNWSNGGGNSVWGWSANRNWNSSVAGNHSHTITGGGDSETRPINVAVNYIIKAN